MLSTIGHRLSPTVEGLVGSGRSDAIVERQVRRFIHGAMSMRLSVSHWFRLRSVISDTSGVDGSQWRREGIVRLVT